MVVNMRESMRVRTRVCACMGALDMNGPRVDPGTGASDTGVLSHIAELEVWDTFVCVPLVLALSALAYRYVEEPARRQYQLMDINN